MDADGSRVSQLTRLRGFAGVPAYSPDERALLFVSDRDGSSDIYVDADGGNPRSLTGPRITEPAAAPFD